MILFSALINDQIIQSGIRFYRGIEQNPGPVWYSAKNCTVLYFHKFLRIRKKGFRTFVLKPFFDQYVHFISVISHNYQTLG